MEKALPLHSGRQQHRLKSWPYLAVCLGLAFIWAISRCCSISSIRLQQEPDDSLCPILDKVNLTSFVSKPETLQNILHTRKFRVESARRMLEAVRIPTQGFDDMIDPSEALTLDELFQMEPRWKPFGKFLRYLEETFPLVHRHLHVEKVNHLGLIYTWNGTDSSKKPLMLTAHYDVVPISPETLGEWPFPPFMGYFDRHKLYGRGALDCKNLLVGLMETVELLLSQNFKPQRTLILAFGYDEELAGKGASAIGKHLLQALGPGSVYQLIDEGSEGVIEIEGRKFIAPATAEKGHLDSFIEIHTPGGHLSVPPKHTAIGLLARLISAIEDQTFHGIITNANPVLSQLQCVAEHLTSLDPALRNTILKAHLDKRANARLLAYLDQDIKLRFLVSTSQAVDMVLGGVKANNLPEHAQVLINHRIALEESVETTRNKVVSQMYDFAQKFDLGLVVDDAMVLEATAHGHLVYTSKAPFEPAPVTPVGDLVWNTYGGALRYFYEDMLGSNDTHIVTPYLDTGNTDTRNYWDLTPNIYRYVPGHTGGLDSHIHSVGENIEISGHTQLVAFYYAYIQMVDQLE